jgi:hypothetical protein
MTTLAGIEFEIIKLELKAGDMLAIKTEQSLTMAQIKELRQRVGEMVPDGVKVTFLK